MEATEYYNEKDDEITEGKKKHLVEDFRENEFLVIYLIFFRICSSDLRLTDRDPTSTDFGTKRIFS
jgi:hypothetical protein